MSDQISKESELTKDILFLSGPPGIGKSTVGYDLASSLRVPFFDLDDEFEKILGPIGRYVNDHGWPAFRLEEARVLTRIIHDEINHQSSGGSHCHLSPSVIVSLGGGTLLSQENRDLVSSCGLTFSLWGTIDQIVARQRNRDERLPSAKRPLPLESESDLALHRLLADRVKIYRQCDLWLEVFEAESVSQLSNRVLRAWRWYFSASPHPNSNVYRPPIISALEDRHVEPILHTNDIDQGQECQRTLLTDYPIFFCSGKEDELLKQIAALCLGRGIKDLLSLGDADARTLRKKKIGVLSDEIVSSIHGAPLVGRLQSLGIDAHLITFPVGEKSKRLRVVEALATSLLQLNFGRDDHLLALGGGVTGDLCGFLAAIYKRGISWSQIPTTLLAQVDSSIGAKTAVNHPLGKNLIGAFYRPKWVWIDESYLETLPIRELRSGWVEAFKHGLINDKAHAEALIELARAKLAPPQSTERLNVRWLPLIRESVSIKAQIVSEDELEQGKRATLNLGHTIGHALESAHQDLLHGEAVALGIVFTAEYSTHYSSLSLKESRWIISTLEELGFDTKWRDRLTPSALEYLNHDKKRRGQSLRFVTLKSVGATRIEEIKTHLFIERLHALFSIK